MDPSSALTFAAAALIWARALMWARSRRCPDTGKFSTARWVWARHLACAGTRMGGDDVLGLLRSVEEDGELPPRLRLAPWCMPGAGPEGLVRLQSLSGRRWRVGGVKCHGQGTAAFWPDPAAYTAAVRHPHEAGDGTATHAIGTDEWSKRLGDERAARAWRCRDLRDAGARLALGSDWPIASYDARQVLATARRPRGAAAG